MLDLRHAKRVAVIGGGLTGWFAALMLRRVFSPNVEIFVFEDPDLPPFSRGAGSLNNFLAALQRAAVDINDFVEETGATFKMGYAYRGWREGGANDVYYDLFPAANNHIEELDFSFRGVWPYLAMRIATKTPFHTIFPGFSLIEGASSQVEARAVFNLQRSGIQPTFHFSVGKVTEYLRQLGFSQQIMTRAQKVEDFVIAENGDVVALNLHGGDEVSVDFVIDASGFSRFAFGRKYKAKWRSFAAGLLQDRALSFVMQNQASNPGFLTQAIALNDGYLWQVPLREQTSATYVFSSKHSDEGRAKEELQTRFGFAINPEAVLSFEPGNFEKIWINNVVALGTASGFIEPLEETSLSQTLQQLVELEKTFVDCHGIIGNHTVEAFNYANQQSFNEIADFVRMHYDGGRRDTIFWRDANSAHRSDAYQAMKACFSQRLPRIIDIDSYVIGWRPLFHLLNWLFVAAPLGIVSTEAALGELNYLPPQIRQRMEQYGAELIRTRTSNNFTQGGADFEPYQNYSGTSHSYFQPEIEKNASSSQTEFAQDEGGFSATYR